MFLRIFALLSLFSVCHSTYLPYSTWPLLQPPTSTNGSRLSIRHFSVPRFVPLEGNATLECDYLQEGKAVLYSLKWYKENAQFYEYIPGKVRKHTNFPVEGIRNNQVHGTDSGRRVFLSRLSVHASGVYRCELVAEGPPFHTSQMHQNMTIVVLPVGVPLLSRSQSSYHSHDKISLNCTPPLAKPAADIRWYINGHSVPNEKVEIVQHQTNPAELHSQTSRLILPLSTARFINGRLDIRCEATLAGLYRKSSAIEVREPSNNLFYSSTLYTISGSPALRRYDLLIMVHLVLSASMYFF